MPVESYKDGEEAKMYARRLKFRKQKATTYRYPFGLLSIVDLMDRALNYRGVKTRNRPPQNNTRTWVGGNPA